MDGKAYAIPLDTHPFVLFYNTKICKKAGLLGDGRASSRRSNGEKEFLDAMQRGQEGHRRQSAASSHPTTDTSTPWRMFQSLYSQLGGEMLADDGTEVVIDDAKARTCSTFMQQPRPGEG